MNKLLVAFLLSCQLMQLCPQQLVFTPDDTDDAAAARHRHLLQDDTKHHEKPVINTFFEPIPAEKRYTDMNDEDDQALLDFWKQTWRDAGWEPRVLTRQDAAKHDDYQAFLQELQQLKLDAFNELQFLKFFVMGATNGGWITDYDVFPVRDFRDQGLNLPNKGQMTLHDILSPSLASGTADAWMTTAKALLEDAKQNVDASKTTTTTNYWSDTLSTLNLQRNANVTLHSSRYVFPSNKGFATETLQKEQCEKRPLRGKRAIHFCPRCMLEGILSKPELRVPRHRLTLARDWLLQWKNVCGPVIANGEQKEKE